MHRILKLELVHEQTNIQFKVNWRYKFDWNGSLIWITLWWNYCKWETNLYYCGLNAIDRHEMYKFK